MCSPAVESVLRVAFVGVCGRANNHLQTVATASSNGYVRRPLEADGLYATLWSVQVSGVDTLPDAFVRRVTGPE